MFRNTWKDRLLTTAVPTLHLGKYFHFEYKLESSLILFTDVHDPIPKEEIKENIDPLSSISALQQKICPSISSSLLDSGKFLGLYIYRYNCCINICRYTCFNA